MRHGAWILAITLVCGAMSAQVSDQPKDLPHYTVTDLGTLGGTFSWATGVNNKGWVDGFSTLPGETCIPPSLGCDDHAFLWQDGIMTDLGTLGGPNSGVGFWGRRPNDQGQIVGAAQTGASDPAGEDFCAFINNFFTESPAPFLCQPFVWQSGVMSPLPALEGNGGASQINNLGQVAGEVDGKPDCPAGAPHPRPVLWENGVLHKLPRLAGFPYGGPNAINDQGQSVGVLVSDCAGTVNHAVLWDRNGATYLGSLGGSAFGEGVDINEEGQVVGFASLAGDAVFHGFFWTKAGGMKDLGTLPGDVFSFAAGINDNGQIVGTSSDANFNPRAFFEQDGVMVDLNALASPSSPLYLLYAFDINSRGEIVGQGFDATTRELHAFLAKPCDQDEGCDDRDTGTPNVVPRPRVIIPDNIRKLLQQRLRFGRVETPPMLLH